MRIHRLEVEAFGPFAGRVEIDLDTAAGAGLFLVHGPTGAGKTTLLDAVCFALYADVPGARGRHGLRSDHAAPDVRPEVVLELTVGGRRLRITRSPAWDRPKKRGSGTTSVPASVVLEERVGSRWEGLSHRNDEVADLVLDLLGMGLSQFASVVLLPQGDFATFLRADPEARRSLLQRLFDISVFADVEQWLVDARRRSAADAEGARSALDAELRVVEELLGSVADEHEHGPAVVDEADLAGLPDRVRGVADDLARRVGEAMARLDAAEQVERAAVAAHDEASTTHERQERAARARRRLTALEADGEAHADRVARLDAADRAATVRGHLRAEQRLRQEAADARARCERARGPLVASGMPADRPAVAVLRDLRDLDPAAAEVVTSRQDAARVAAELAGTAERRLATAEAATAAQAAHAEAVAAASDAGERVRVLARAAEGADGHEERVRRLEASASTLDDLERDRSAREDLVPALLEAREHVADRREALVLLRERRVDSMAAELADALVDGRPCTVCGATEHPAPAAAGDRVNDAALEDAESRLTEASERLDALAGEARRLEAAVETREGLLEGSTRAEVTAALDDARAARAAARAATAELAGAQTAEAVSRAEAEGRGGEHTRALATLDALDARSAELETDAERAASALTAATDAHAGCPCGSADASSHDTVREALEALRRAEEALGGAEERLARAEVDLAAALADAGFETAEDCAAAALPTTEADRLRDAVHEHVRSADAARSVLAEPEVAAALALDPPDLPVLEDARAGARREVLGAHQQLEALRRADRALGRVAPRVLGACEQVAALTHRHDRLRDLADTVVGTSPDNTLKMRLTSFVLAARLEAVAARANERLAVMGGGRYVLEHSDDRVAGGKRSGLGLRVLDQWTGRARDTASLSGGESFMASLALALGLADAVREESGGLDLGTLFVDEGFGSLDDDSLEQVLTVLDGLREGGRAVGVVSHVADLRTRVPHQVVVEKGVAGSTASVRVADGAPAA
ncbi:SMC family ATPase [Phycicoccus sp. BSK3Z-2]|uniref:Nuclease SbcCD subunit C n=1 Tax=Phycicoccus avicenniae TaxID=2828860 RepID=A0A941D751_9MICO|nr:SMC family ATPase [Phycicoccus avicenniae]MBR7742353.1 SMC family ATPase [Phycicoccus avicenniae]